MFSKELCRSSLLCRCYDSVCICVCIVGHGYTTKSAAGICRFSASQSLIRLVFVSASHQTGLETKSNDLKSDYSGDYGKGRSARTMLFISLLSAMWPKHWSEHGCLIIA